MISSSGIVEVDVVLYEYSRVPVRVPCTATGTSTRQDFSLSRFNPRLHRAARSGGSETTRSRERAAGE